jgi:hypothetical protein
MSMYMAAWNCYAHRAVLKSVPAQGGGGTTFLSFPFLPLSSFKKRIPAERERENKEKKRSNIS